MLCAILVFCIAVIAVIALCTLPHTLFNILCILFLTILSMVAVYFLCPALKEKFAMGNKKNIYGKSLKKCETSGPARLASQMQDYTCSEIGGGFHQICIKNMGKGKNFSKSTGQTDWSSERGSRNHCACLGAWANFTAQKGADKKLYCDAIPETALEDKYVSNWESWNDVTIANQAESGINELYNQCINQATDSNSRKYLQNLYCKLVNSPKIHLKDISKKC